MHFCFVILHYKTDEDTIECVHSIQKLNKPCSIVIVDNASNNGSIERIEKTLKGEKNIYIIKNSENFGFASGNNIGYEYAKKQLNADFVAISNNDIIVKSNDMIEYLEDLYNRKPFHIAGPDIVSMVDNGHQNPMITSNPNINTINKAIFKYRALYLISRLGIYDILKKHKNNDCNKHFSKTVLESKENVQLHGSFVIFSPSFLKAEEEAFRSGTFLYMEESILFQYCLKKNYTTVFTPDIKVFHKEDSSTNSLFIGNKKKREFVFKNLIKSLKVYREFIK